MISRVATLCFACLCCANAGAQTLLVPSQFPTIQSAIDAAAAGETVVVSPGVYMEQIDLLGKAITVRSEDPDDPTIVATTIIDGGNDPDAPGFPQNVGTVVACRNNEGPDTMLLGLTIRGGAASNGAGLFAGGGLGMFQSNPTVTNCRFVDNNGTNADAPGGGVYCGFGGPITFTGCEFIGNSARSGGGLYVQNNPLTLVNCLFRDNNTTGDGGGLTWSGDSATIMGCDFENNNADDSGGGAYVRGNGDKSVIQVTDCDFRMNDSGDDGGGLFIWNGEATISDCEFVLNTTVDNGGGVNAIFHSELSVQDCTFTDNESDRSGGGLHVFLADSTVAMCQFSGNDAVRGGGGAHLGGVDSRHVIRQCTFDDNTTDGDGGGAQFVFSEFNIDDCDFTNNRAGDAGGGASMSFGERTRMTRCRFEDNFATGSGGGFGFAFPEINFLIDECSFERNRAFGNGGGLNNSSGDAGIFRNCVLAGNTALRGGAISDSNSNANTTYVNCALLENGAEQGGAIWDSSSVTYSGMLIAGNQATTGGAVYAACDSPTFVNTTIVDNSATASGGSFFLTCTGLVEEPTKLYNTVVWGTMAPVGAVASINVNMNMTVGHSDVQGGQAAIFAVGGLTWEPGNIDADPLFVDPDGTDNDPSTARDNDYRLGAGSPCIDAGDNQRVPQDTADLDGDEDTSEALPLDFDGELRFVDDPDIADTGQGSAPIVDMGAFEFQVGGLLGDMNCDGAVTVGDINPFVLALTDPAGYANAFPDCDLLNGDCSDDGQLTVGDINCFVALVTGG